MIPKRILLAITTILAVAALTAATDHESHNNATIYSGTAYSGNSQNLPKGQQLSCTTTSFQVASAQNHVGGATEFDLVLYRTANCGDVMPVTVGPNDQVSTIAPAAVAYRMVLK